MEFLAKHDDHEVWERGRERGEKILYRDKEEKKTRKKTHLK